MSALFLSMMLGGLVLLLVSVAGLVIATAVWIEQNRQAACRAHQRRAWKKIEKEWRAAIKK